MSQCLILGNDPPIHDPSWQAVAKAAGNVVPTRSVILCKADKRHIRADGARRMFTIVYYRDAQTPPLLIGRPPGSVERGKVTLSDQRVLTSSLEYWAADGVAVFRAFFDDEPLDEQFVLRDPRTEYTPDEIRGFLRRGGRTRA